MLLLLTACAQGTGENRQVYRNYTRISQKEALQMMERDDGHDPVSIC